MTYHVAAFSEQILAPGTLQPIAAVPDTQIFTSGDDIRVPAGLDHLLAAFSIGSAQTRARVVAPSLRAFANHEIAPKNIAESIRTPFPNRLIVFTRNPIPLAVGESLNYESDGGSGAGVGRQTGVILLGDGPVVPVLGAMRTVRATAAIAAPEAVWTSGALTFSEDLPAGIYQVVGGRCEADNPGAFRLIFVSGGPRPGSLAVLDAEGSDVTGSRMGSWGVWGQFDTNQPPTLEILSLAGPGLVQILYLEIIRV